MKLSSKPHTLPSIEDTVVKITYDREVDALYIRLRNITVETDLVGEGIALDYDEEGQVTGIEILNAGKRLDELRNSRTDAKSHLSELVGKMNVALKSSTT